MGMHKSFIEKLHLTTPDEIYMNTLNPGDSIRENLEAPPRYIIFLYAKSANTAPIGQIISVIVDVSDPYCFEAYYSSAGQYVSRHDRSNKLYFDWGNNYVTIQNINAYQIRSSMLVYY